MALVGRAYNSFEIDHDRGILIKKSSSDRLKDEIEYYKSLPEHLKIYFPRFLGDQKHKSEYSLSLEYYKYNNLSHYMLNCDFDKVFWEKVASTIYSNLCAFSLASWVKGNPDYRKAMFITKTLTEYKNLLKSPIFKQMAKPKSIKLNGRTLDNFEQVWPEIEKKLTAYCTDANFGVIHGDLCFSNILCGKADDGVVIRYIDMRGSFGEKGIYGDSIYDYAKLAHSTDGGYEYFIYDKFDIKHDNKLTDFTLTYHNDNKKIIHEIFQDRIYKLADEKLIQMVQGTIYVGMCARHYDSVDRQKAMYLVGLKLLNEALL